MTPSCLRIRPARPDEAEALTALALRSKASNGYDAAFMAACRDELTVRFGEGRTIRLAQDRTGRLAGFFTLCCGGGAAEVDAFFVDPAAKRSGVGRMLWRDLERQALVHGARTVMLDADPQAVPFYRAMGLRVTGRAASGSIPGRFLPHMRKALARGCG
jgi:GNAT superfamily N-acetyltransferase